MKTLAKVVAVVCLVMVCAGYSKVNQNESTELVTVTQVVHSGDTLWSIGEKLYDAKNEGICFEEWMYNQKQNNKKYFANGRALQPGDKLTIVCRVKK